VVSRGVYERGQGASWNEAFGRYIEENDYLTRAGEKMGLDQYISALASGRPQIYGLYWSQPQMAARQHENMDRTRRFLNRLWNATRDAGTQEFGPERQANLAES